MYAAGLKKDFGSTAIVCAALCVGMLSLLGYRDYCSYALLPLLPLVLFEYRKVDRACLLLLAFSAVYTFWQYVNGYHYSPSSILFGMLYPFIVYQAGGLIVEKQHNPKSAVVLILCMMSYLAGIRGSIFSSILILLFSAVYIRNLAVFYKYEIISRFEKNIMLIVGVTLMLQFAVEPVIEGEPQLFWFFIFTASVIIHLNRKYRDTECCGKEPAGA